VAAFDPNVLPQPPEATPYAQAPQVQPAEASNQPKVQDVLVAVAQKEGPDGASNLQTNVAITDIRSAAKEQLQGQKRTKKNTRNKKNAPQFLRINTRFSPGRPLVVAYTSPKGGVAKSTTAANYAAYIAKAAELSNAGDSVRVLLVDGDVANGNLALRVSKRLSPNMLDMINHMDQLNGAPMDNWQRDIGPFVLAHPKIANLDVLAAPDNPNVIDQIHQSDLDTLMKSWAQFYQVVVFDTGTQITEFTNCAWLNYSSQVYLMVEPELACLNSTSEYAKRSRSFGLLAPDECRVVCVRADMEIGDITPEQIVSEIFSFVPPERQFYWPDFHRDAIAAGNAGEFLALESAEYAAALTPLVRQSLLSYEQEYGL
jgi:Flp pilus assembly CpaE family ATPase